MNVQSHKRKAWGRGAGAGKPRWRMRKTAGRDAAWEKKDEAITMAVI